MWAPGVDVSNLIKFRPLHSVSLAPVIIREMEGSGEEQERSAMGTGGRERSAGAPGRNFLKLLEKGQAPPDGGGACHW